MNTNLRTFLKAGALAVFVGFLAGQARGEVVRLEKSQIESIDRTNMTLTLKIELKAETLTVSITPETRLLKSGKYIITRDLAVGDRVTGTVRKTPEGKHEAVRLSVQAPAVK
jgi:hypothetical protein